MNLLVQDGRLDPESEFVKQTLPALKDVLSSGGATVLAVDRMDYLTKAKAGLESEIATALRLSLTP